MRKAKAIELDDAQRKKLVKLAHSNTAQVRLARRAGIVLLAADGFDNHEIGKRLGVGRVQAGRWRARYAVGGVKAIAQDLPRGGRKPKIDPADIVGLYMSPPEHALVLCCDENSQVQAFDRTQPGLPMKPGRAATMTHDHKLHLVCDNCATHKHPNAKEWLAKHPRLHVHFTPTSASWPNMVERFFRDTTTGRLRSGVFRSVPELATAIKEYIAVHNNNPKPFTWTAKAQDILAKVIRANSRLSSKQNEALHYRTGKPGLHRCRKQGQIRMKISRAHF